MPPFIESPDCGADERPPKALMPLLLQYGRGVPEEAVGGVRGCPPDATVGAVRSGAETVRRFEELLNADIGGPPEGANWSPPGRANRSPPAPGNRLLVPLGLVGVRLETGGGPPAAEAAEKKSIWGILGASVLGSRPRMLNCC